MSLSLDSEFRQRPVTFWLAEHVASIGNASGLAIGPIARTDLVPVAAGLDYWDMWPVADSNGMPVSWGDETLWLALAAPTKPDPEERHALARIHLLVRVGQAWRDCGPAFPDDFTPGSREWSGSAVYTPEDSRLTVYFTAAGRRDEQSVTFEQRLFEASGTLVCDDGRWRIEQWCPPIECVQADGGQYMIVNQAVGEVGTIKAFRDPAWFQDPATMEELLFFTASAPRSTSRWNGLIGLASRSDPAQNWQAEGPLISADGLNNELERPHMLVVGGQYYLFWSTQTKVFADGGPVGPTGLYGMVGPTARGPFMPLNGSGLVAANPTQHPWQAYSWWVLADLTVISFADLVEAEPGTDLNDPMVRRRHFGGVPAPEFRLEISDTAVRPVPI